MVARDPIEIGFAELGEAFGKPALLARAAGVVTRRGADVLELTAAEHLSVTGDDLFGQRRARARHADDEDRQDRSVRGAGHARDPLGVVERDRTVDDVGEFCWLVAGSVLLVARREMCERLIDGVVRVVELAEREVQQLALVGAQFAVGEHALDQLAGLVPPV